MTVPDDARRVHKWCKNGLYESVGELSDEEIGKLYRYYPWVLPLVDWPEGGS